MSKNPSFSYCGIFLKFAAVLATCLALTRPMAAQPSPVPLDATTARIDGVADFLVKRANYNAVYILQQRMSKNHILECYFPETYNALKSADLQLLLQAGPDLWKESVEKDLSNFGPFLLDENLNPVRLEKWRRTFEDEFRQFLGSTTIGYQDVWYTLDAHPPKTAPPEIRTLIQDFHKSYLEPRLQLRESIRAAIARSSGTDCPATSTVTLVGLIRGFGNSIDNLKLQVKALKGAELWSNGEKGLALSGADFFVNVTTLTTIDERVNHYVDELKEINRSTSTVVRVFRINQVIKESIDMGDNPLIPISTSTRHHYDDFRNAYADFSRYALSLAMLTEAKSPQQVQSVIQQLALPPVSFASKRKDGVTKIMVTAYFGAGGGAELSSHSKSYGGLNVPIGLEISHGVSYGTWSLLLAPLDFAHPANEEIANTSGNTAKFRDILAPGAYISYGVKTLPIVGGVGYTYGPALTVTDQASRGRLFGFVALDMPLFPLY